MKLTDLVSALSLETHAGEGNLERPVTGGIVSDLLSYVMGKAQAGNLWVTIQVHPNIVGVADLLDLSAVVVAGGQEPEAATVAPQAMSNRFSMIIPQNAAASPAVAFRKEMRTGISAPPMRMEKMTPNAAERTINNAK